MKNRLVALGAVVLIVCLGGARAEAQSAPNPWVPCGSLENLRNGPNRCEISGFPVVQWEYGFAFNSREVYVANCLEWNVGLRVVNRIPYAVNSDNPSTGWQLGGAVFYTETFAADDDIPNSCPSGTWRHRYWRITGDGDVRTDIFSNGCFNLPMFCRKRV